MTSMTIPLSDESAAVLKQRAAQEGVLPEDYLQRHVEWLLTQPDEAFRDATAYILAKNAELYRRLA